MANLSKPKCVDLFTKNVTNFVLRGYKYKSVVFILVNFIGWSKQALMVATNIKMAPLW